MAHEPLDTVVVSFLDAWRLISTRSKWAWATIVGWAAIAAVTITLTSSTAARAALAVIFAMLLVAADLTARIYRAALEHLNAALDAQSGSDWSDV